MGVCKQMSERNFGALPGVVQTDGILVEDLTKSFNRSLTRLFTRKKDRVLALDSFSIRIQQGEFLGIIGPNGAGKTTFMGCLLGFLTPDGGSVLIDGLPPNSLPIRRIIGYLPERLNFDRWMTARKFLSYHHALSEQPAAVRREEVEELLTKVGLQQSVWSTEIAKFSRGMLQRLGLAQALIGKPRYLFLDEPASGVDPGGVLIMRKVLTDLKEQGTTVVLNSHQLDQVEKVCDRVAFVKDGKVEAIEDLLDIEHQSRVVLIRFDAREGALPGLERMREIASQCNAQMKDHSYTFVRVMVNGNADLRALTKRLIEDGYPVVEVVSETRRLEQYFVEN